ncbi:SHOCT domain-containing protein [Halosolutus halophilus]|uniref:SHOCT domain-containing protein n=1 Tax=Halosolutus halophilus TaxID=1552990 RepID=UPI002234F429|nr:SHOCT domain-containing protein [Halosolutus halophilus]
MTTNTTDRQLVWVVLAIVAALVVFPMFAMGFGIMGAGPMMGGMWDIGMWGADGVSGWMLIIGVGMQLLFLAVIVGAVYLGYRAVTKQDESSDPALEELRAAYARGDLSDEGYERRRNRLETEP